MGNRSSTWKLAGLVTVFAAMGAAGLWWLKIHDFDIRRSIDAGVETLRAAGPFAFFLAMAILPAVGAPISFFYLMAGTAFTPQLGLAGVLVCTGVALAINMALTYWLASYGLRPWLEEMISRTKYRIPVFAPEEQAQITLILRITPGPPFCLQSYLLGLARVKFVTYLIVSWVVAVPMATGVIIFGDAILNGKGKLAFLGLSAIVAASLIIHVLRRHYGKKRA